MVLCNIYMNDTSEQFKNRVMRRVHLTYVVRRVFHALTLKTAGILIFVTP